MRKILRDKKGIDTILAALLMVVIVVVASVMVYAWSTGLLGSLLVTPSAGKEALNMETAAFGSAYNVTINIRNTGTAAVTLVTYYVKDTSGNTYTQQSWPAPQPSINPNAVNPTNILIGTGGGAQCNGCTLSGATYIFSAGNSYTVTVVTSRNSQFVFTVTR